MRQTTPWLQPDCLFRWLPQGKEHQRCLSILHSFTEKVIQERKVEYYERKKEQLTQTEVDGDQSFTSISCRFFKKNISQLFLYDSWFKEKQRLAFLDFINRIFWKWDCFKWSRYPRGGRHFHVRSKLLLTFI